MKKISQSGAFVDFVKNNYIYVDKTETIYNLIDLNKKVFISRPRRFGKSLTLDTIATLFENGVDPYFKNTWIYDKWTEPTCPVLRLNFLNYQVTDISEFKRGITLALAEFVNKYQIEGYIEDRELINSLVSLFNALKNNDRQIVILIDEYDCQLSANINNPKLYEEFRTVIRGLYGAIKDRSEVRFMMVTGVTRLKDVSIFSVGSDIIDISNHNAYSQLIGFTRDEIRYFYKDYLKLAASIANKCSLDEVTEDQTKEILSKMAENYDGYCFDEFGENKVFSTWSVNNFLSAVNSKRKVDYGEYWYDNGGLPSILINYLKTHQLDHLDLTEKNLCINVKANDYKNPTTLLDINQSVLMCQTGYLTLRSPVGRSSVLLGIPNKEVYNALINVYSLNLFTAPLIEFTKQGHNIIEAGSSDEILDFLNATVNSVPYDRYPLNDEASVQTILLIALKSICDNATSELHSSKGRADIVAEHGNRRVVFELKFAQNETEAKNKINEAIEQIMSRDYGNILPKKDLLRIAAVFNADPKVRSFTQFKIV